MATRVPILTFHALDDQASNISFSPRLFGRGMAKLHRHGYQTLTLPEVVDRLRAGNPWPDRSLLHSTMGIRLFTRRLFRCCKTRHVSHDLPHGGNKGHGEPRQSFAYP